LQEDELLNVEEGTLDLANAAPGNKGRERVTDQIKFSSLPAMGFSLFSAVSLSVVEHSFCVEQMFATYSEYAEMLC